MNALEARKLTKENESVLELRINNKLKSIYDSIKEATKEGLNFTYVDLPHSVYKEISTKLRDDGYSLDMTNSFNYILEW